MKPCDAPPLGWLWIYGGNKTIRRHHVKQPKRKTKQKDNACPDPDGRIDSRIRLHFSGDYETLLSGDKDVREKESLCPLWIGQNGEKSLWS